MAIHKDSYPATLEIEDPGKLDRLSTFFRIILSIPALALVGLLMGGSWDTEMEKGQDLDPALGGLGLLTSLFIVTALMIVIRQRYPKWWFDFGLEFQRFATRVSAYVLLLTDKYPSTEDAQSVRLDITYPDAKKDLNRWMPLIKWLLAFPHYFILIFLISAAFIAAVIAWFAILFTGRYPKGLFNFVVGVFRWNLRVTAYTSLLTTDKYPPFSLK